LAFEPSTVTSWTLAKYKLVPVLLAKGGKSKDGELGIN